MCHSFSISVKSGFQFKLLDSNVMQEEYSNSETYPVHRAHYSKLLSHENWVLLGYYAASGGNFLQTIQDNLLVHPQGSRGSLNPEDGINSLSEKWVRNYHYSLHNNLEKHSSHLLYGGWMISSYHMINVIQQQLIKIRTK